MKPVLNMVFAGFGGQGVLFSGKIVAYAGLLEGKQVSWLPSYGPEMRGGTANCSVCISDEPIGSPLVTEPNILVAMNGPSFDKFIHSVAAAGKVIIDSSLVNRICNREDVSLFPIPATQLAAEKGLEGIANIILLGKVLKETCFAGVDTVREAFKKCVPASKMELLEPNLRAIELGMEL